KCLGWKGRLEEAIAEYREAIQLEKDDPTFHNNFGTAPHNKGELEHAIAEYQEAFWLNKYKKDIADLSKAIKLDPKNAEFWSYRGNAYIGLHQYDKGIADLNKAIELDPKNASDSNDLAWLFATCPDPKFRDPKRAVELAKKAVELAPKAGGLWNTLGAARYR